MFVKLLHGLQSVIGGFVQKWTNDNIPSDISLLHDFRDGLGYVPGAPVDEVGVRADLLNIREIPIISASDGAGVEIGLLQDRLLPLLQNEYENVGVAMSLTNISKIPDVQAISSTSVLVYH